MAEESGEVKTAAKGSNKIFIIIGAIVLVLLLIVGGIVAALLSGGDDKMADAQQMQSGNAMMGEDDSMPTTIRLKKTYLKVGALYEMPRFIVNLVTKKGKRYLRITMNLEMDNDSLMGELDAKKAILSDIVLSVLSSKTVEDLSSIKGKARAKAEIRATINKSLLDGKIKNIFFTEFIIQ